MSRRQLSFVAWLDRCYSAVLPLCNVEEIDTGTMLWRYNPEQAVSTMPVGSFVYCTNNRNGDEATEGFTPLLTKRPVRVLRWPSAAEIRAELGAVEVLDLAWTCSRAGRDVGAVSRSLSAVPVAADAWPRWADPEWLALAFGHARDLVRQAMQLHGTEGICQQTHELLIVNDAVAEPTRLMGSA